MNNKWSLKYLLSDTNLIRDVKTIASFILAYAVAVVSNGLVEDFSPQALLSIAVTLGAFGTYFAIRVITNEFTDRGMFDEEESNVDLQNRLAAQKKLSAEVKTAVAYDILTAYNKDKVTYLKKVKYQEEKHQLENDIKRYEAIIENLKITFNIRWFSIIKQRTLNAYKSRLKKFKTKLLKLSEDDMHVRYKPVTLNQLRVAYSHEEENKLSTSERFDITPQKKIRKQMAITNFAKTFLLVSFQGAAIATISSWSAFGIFLVFITFTLVTTALFSYVSVRRYASMSYIAILDEKNELLTRINKEAEQFKTPETLEDLFKNHQSIDEFYQI